VFRKKSLSDGGGASCRPEISPRGYGFCKKKKELPEQDGREEGI